MRYLFTTLLILMAQLSFSTTFHPYSHPRASLKNLVIFGDSLSDNGNLYEYMHHQLPESPPYFNGRFSNGPIWAEHLAQSYFNQAANQHLQDYAFGGAGVLNDVDEDEELFTLNREINTYLLAHNNQADNNSMFFIWIGGNNYLGLPDDMDTTVNDVINGIQKSTERLVQKGAKYITIMNMPDLSQTPLAKELDNAPQFKLYTDTHNQRLLLMYKKLRQMYPTVQWFYFDANQIFNNAIQHPADYGFENTTDSCHDAQTQPSSPRTVLEMSTSVSSSPNNLSGNAQQCNNYVFFDLIHPTTRVHQITAESIVRMFRQEKIRFKA